MSADLNQVQTVCIDSERGKMTTEENKCSDYVSYLGGMTGKRAVERALKMLIFTVEGWEEFDNGSKVHPIGYRLKPGHNGGMDPTAEHCGQWSYGGRQLTADCIGLVMWASGLNRWQKGYKGPSGEWLDCNAIFKDAKENEAGRAAREWSYQVTWQEAKLGDWVVTPKHIEMVIRPECNGNNGPLLIGCSPRFDTTCYQSIGVGRVWDRSAIVVRPLHYNYN